MALIANALVTLADLESMLSGTTFTAGTSAKAQAERAINVATTEIERLTGRVLVNTTSLTEYHTVPDERSRLVLLDWPIQTLTSVHEDAQREYGDDYLLTVSEDYISVAPKGELIRVWESGGECAWEMGFRAIKVVYTPGYASTTTVPSDLADLCLEIAARIFKETDRKTWGLSGQSDAAGNWQRFAPGVLTPQIRERVESFGRPKWDRTGERDS